MQPLLQPSPALATSPEAARRHREVKVFWVPVRTRGEALRATVGQPQVGRA